MNSAHEDSRVVTGDGPINRRTALQHDRLLREEAPLHPDMAERLDRVQARSRLGAPLADTIAQHTEATHAPATPWQILAGVVAAAGVVVAMLGAIESSRWPLALGLATAALGAVGWWAARPRPSSAEEATGPAALFDSAALAAFDASLHAAAAELSEETAAQVVRIKEAFQRLGPQRPAHDEHFTLEDRLFLRECLRRYLPDSLQAFLRVPAAQRNAQLHDGQPSAEQALLQQLRMLHEEVLQREKKIGRSAAEHVLRQQRFLESKKSR